MDKWAPTIGSGLIALATLVVLIVTMRQNREALKEARSREYAEWERDTLTTNTAKALEASTRVSHGILSSLTKVDLEREWVDVLQAEVASILSAAAILQLFTDGSLARDCKYLATTCQVAIAHMTANWSGAKEKIATGEYDDLPSEVEGLIEWMQKIDAAGAQLGDACRGALSLPNTTRRQGWPRRQPPTVLA